VSGFPVSGKTDVVLPIEGYTVTFGANGGVFEGGGTVITMTVLENGLLTPPSAPHSERDFVGWYRVGKRFTAETRITGDTAVYAGWLIGIADIVDYLTNAQDGYSSTSPVPLVLNSDLTNGGWESILSALTTAGKYVVLDISACTMNGTEFDPGTGIGVDKVTALILPNTAKSIKAGTSGNATFKAFTALRPISGAGVETIGDGAFSSCASLAEVNLPSAEIIGRSAFSDCTSLTEVSLPAATSIRKGAFSDCTSLTTVSLPATPPSLERWFTNTGSSGAIIVSVPAGAVATYTSAWGVDVETLANGNTSKYGPGHKAVLITDAAQ
jgi:hypothetical protein